MWYLISTLMTHFPGTSKAKCSHFLDFRLTIFSSVSKSRKIFIELFLVSLYLQQLGQSFDIKHYHFPINVTLPHTRVVIYKRVFWCVYSWPCSCRSLSIYSYHTPLFVMSLQWFRPMCLTTEDRTIMYVTLFRTLFVWKLSKPRLYRVMSKRKVMHTGGIYICI